MIRTRLVGTGSHVPERIVTNDDLTRRLETSDEWIRTRTGIRQRHVLSDGEVTSDMCATAGQAALDMAGLAAEDLDLIVVSTVTPDMPMPSCAVITQHKLGARCPAFDLGAACAGFSYGLTVVDGLVRGGRFGKVLLIGAEALSRFVDWNDRGTCILFGDGAGAVVAVAEEQRAGPGSPDARGVLSTHIAADGAFVPQLQIAAGGTALPPSHDTIDAGQHFLTMDGRAVFSQAVKSMSDACERVLADQGLTTDQIDWVLPHQANLRIIDAICKRLKIERESVLVNLERFGNTSAASIPLALDEAVRDGRIVDGSTVLSCGMGAGLVWGAALLRW